jgi:hypothetical protein
VKFISSPPSIRTGRLTTSARRLQHARALVVAEASTF